MAGDDAIGSQGKSTGYLLLWFYR